MKKPIATLISDIHYNLQTLPLADAALRQAVTKANSLNVPLIIAGDLHDTKANMRGECINAMIETVKGCFIPPYILVGNHDRLNEKAPEHSLNFLAPYAIIVEHSDFYEQLSLHLIPYNHDKDELRAYLKTVHRSAILVMHQGIQGSNSGEYFVDKTALAKEDLAGFRVISGHYHARQTINLPNGGKFDYIGNPFTLTYGEAADPEKGFQVLYDDGSLEFIPTNLRKHIKLEVKATELPEQIEMNPEDLLWLRILGSYEEISHFTRAKIANYSGLPLTGWKLDLIVEDANLEVTKEMQVQAPNDLLDSVIDLQNISDEQKSRLKALWKASLEKIY